ncbi:MAG: FAD-dependent oxidoreductase [Planctomycetes bacterium]|nr:FAD-dependent oxidoreductase [Planctomycetota bacterium]
MPAETPNTLPVPMPLPDFRPVAPSSGVRSFTEPAREIPVIAEADVAVLGGGPAGVMAAVAAARNGARVVLVERHAYFGGMACAANVNIWHQLWSPDYQTKVIGGLPEEILLRLETLGAVRKHGPDGRGHYVICTESAKLAFDDMVVGSGVRILLHAWLAGAVRSENGAVEAAIVESKSGRGAIRAKVFVDATGDADLCARAGAPTTTGGANGKCQPPTLCFRIGGVDQEKAKAAGVNNGVIQRELFAHVMDYNGGKYPTFLWGAQSVWRPDELMLAGTRVPGVVCSKTDDFTRAEVEARYQMRWVLKHLKQFAGYEKLYLVDVGAQIGVRETRRIQGEYEITERELLEGVRFEDTIAQGVYPVDIHNPDGPGILFRHLDGVEREVAGDGSVSNRRWDGQIDGAPKRATPCYSVPYRSLIPRGLTNVLVAGRCVAATHEAAGALRVMINAMSFGHAAGLAAAAASTRHDGSVRAVDPSELRKQLKREGVPLLNPTPKLEAVGA